MTGTLSVIVIDNHTKTNPIYLFSTKNNVGVDNTFL